MPVLFSACGKQPGDTPSYGKQPQYASFRDIPGVTEEEIWAIEDLQFEYESFLVVNLPSTEGFTSPDGTSAGFAPMFCDLLSGLFGIHFIQEFHPFDYMMTGINNLTIDFTGDLTPTPERMQRYYMTHSIAERRLGIVVFGDSEKIKDENDINGLKAGFYEGTITAQFVMDKYPELKFEIVNLQNFHEVIESLISGIIDVFIVDANMVYDFNIYPGFYSQTLFPLVYTPVALTTANPALEPVISVINKYITSGGIDTLYELYKAGNYEYAKYELGRSFTAEERDYIEELRANGGKIPVALEHDNYPVCFYNENNKRFEGIAPDILAEISSITGIEFDVVTTANTTWSEIIEQLRSDKAALVSELMYSEERKGNFLWTDRPYAVSSYILMSKSDYPALEMYQVLRATVGIVRDTIHDELYNEWFPGNTNATYYDNQEEALIALEKDEVDLLMESEYGLLAQINLREKTGYKTNIQLRSPAAESFFGFNKNEEVLRSIFSKSQNFINCEQIARTWSSRTYDYAKKYAHERFIYMTVSAAILLLLLLLLSILFIRNLRASKQLEHQARAVLAASRAKGIFLATMSHEIRTPLTAIIGMAYIAKDCVADNEKALRSINQIMTSSRYLLGILNDILDMSKIESGKLELTHEPFSLLAACSEVADIMRHRCEEKDITFITNIHEIKDITLIGDKLRLNQVFINLLGNAVKFTGANGEIKFITEILEENAEQARARFSVTDNGIGMSEEQTKKLFIPFEQADSTIAARFGGTGLGLSLSQNFVNMMGGKISVSSELDKGSTFDFSLWFNKGKAAPQTLDEKENYENANFNGKRLLLVEDMEINRLIVRELLLSSGLSIDEAEDGRKAVEAFSGSPEGYYDIILMDIQMPVLDGYEAVKEIRALDRADAKTVPIIAMTAHAYKEDVEQALAAGMNGHVAKPIEKPALMETIGKIIEDREG
jgi:signal transduction histidine kinase/BarA-like signal transduction histidine kinase